MAGEVPQVPGAAQRHPPRASLLCLQDDKHLRVHGGLADEDRIFTNLYGEADWRLGDALKRVRVCWRGGGVPAHFDFALPAPCFDRAIGTRPRTCCGWALRASCLR